MYPIDIAIGAPNEDEGAGAVYIFNGKSGRMNEVHSQRIAAKTSFNGIKSFGTYISRPLDIDNNKYAGMSLSVKLKVLFNSSEWPPL